METKPTAYLHNERKNETRKGSLRAAANAVVCDTIEGVRNLRSPNPECSIDIRTPTLNKIAWLLEQLIFPTLDVFQLQRTKCR